MVIRASSCKAAVVVRDDLAPWQRLNVTAFLVSGIVGAAEAEAIGETYSDADGVAYLPLLVQPLLVFESSASHLQRARDRAASRGVPLAIYTMQMFSTGSDAENRAAVRAVATEQLDLVGIGIRTSHRDADAASGGTPEHRPIPRCRGVRLRRLDSDSR